MLELRKLRLEKGLTQAELAKKLAFQKFPSGNMKTEAETLRFKLSLSWQTHFRYHCLNYNTVSYQMIFLIQEKSFLIMLSMKIIRLT